MKKLKRSFLLTEVLVCLSLTGLFLSVMSFWQIRTAQSAKQATIAYELFNEENIFYKRLRKVYTGIQKDAVARTDEIDAFLFDRGISKNPGLSGIVRGALCYSRIEEVLKLRVSDPDQNESEEYTLLKHVISVEYRDCSNGTVELIVIRKEKKPFKERRLNYFFVKDHKCIPI